MISPRLTKVLRDIWSNKTRTLLVVLSIAVGVFAVGSTLSIQDVLSREMDRNWRASNPLSFSVTASGFGKDFVDSIRQMPHVAEAEGRGTVLMLVRTTTSDQLKYIELNALPNFNDVGISRIEKADVATGDWPPNKRDVILSTNSLNFLGVKIGDNITLQVPGGQKYTVRVAGTAHTVDEVAGPFMYTATGYVTFDTWSWLNFGRDFDTLLVRADKTKLGDPAAAFGPADRAYLQTIVDQIKDRVQLDRRDFRGADIPIDPSRHPAAQTVDGIAALMTAIGIAALLMSSFLVINTVGAVLAQHVRQIGMMKAIGARTSQLSRMYFGMVALFGTLSLFVAVPLGIIAANLFVKSIGEDLLNLKISDYSAPPWVFVVQVLIGLIAPVIAAVAPVVGGTRKTVREAISDYGIGQQKNSKPVGQWGRAVPRPLLISLRNTVRRKGRLLMTLLVLVLGGAIFIGVVSARDGLTKTTDVAMAYWNYDIEVKMARDYPTEQMEHAALAVPGVVGAESWTFADARRMLSRDKDGLALTLIAPPAETSMLKPIVLQGRWLRPGDQDSIVLNTDVTKTEADLKVGDEIELKINANATVRAKLKVVGLVQGVLAGPYGYMNRPGLARLIGTGSKANTLVVRTDSREDSQQAAIAKAIEDHFRRINLPTGGTRLSSNLRAALGSQFDIIIYLLLGMAVLLAVVGGLGLAGTMSINVLERTREIGVMRAIGASNGSIRTIVVVEGVVVGLLSWALGALLSLPFSVLINNLVGAALNFEVLYTFSVLGLLIWLAVVIGIAALASLLPAWSASRLTVREVLAYS